MLETQKSPEVFERKSLKFWVPPNNVTVVTSIIQRNLPIHRRGMIHSVYLENQQGDMYARMPVVYRVKKAASS